MGSFGSKVVGQQRVGSSHRASSPSEIAHEENAMLNDGNENAKESSRLEHDTPVQGTETHTHGKHSASQIQQDSFALGVFEGASRNQRSPSGAAINSFSELQELIAEVLSKHDQEIQALKDKLEAEEKQKEAQQAASLREIDSLQESHEEDIEKLEAEHKNDIEKLRADHKNEVELLEAKHQKEFHDLKAQYDRLLDQHIAILEENQGLRAQGKIGLSTELNPLKRKLNDDISPLTAKRTKLEQTYAPPPIMPSSFIWNNVRYINPDAVSPSKNPSPNEVLHARITLRNHGKIIAYRTFPDLCNEPGKNRGRVKRGMWIWVPDPHPQSNVSLASDDYVTSTVGDMEVKMRLMYVLRVDGQNIYGLLCYSFKGQGPKFQSQTERDGYIPIFAYEQLPSPTPGFYNLSYNFLYGEGRKFKPNSHLNLEMRTVSFNCPISISPGKMFALSKTVLKKLIKERSLTKSGLIDYEDEVPRDLEDKIHAEMDACMEARRNARINGLTASNAHRNVVPKDILQTGTGVLRSGATKAMEQMNANGSEEVVSSKVRSKYEDDGEPSKHDALLDKQK